MTPTDTELAFIGLARSGNHIIIHWALRHLSDSICFMNNVGLNGNALECVASYGEVVSKQHPCDATLVSYTFEDKTLNDCRRSYLGYRKNVKTILILRDPFNLFASRLEQEARGLMPAVPDVLSRELWLEHAHKFLSVSQDAHQDFIPISYNAWVQCRWYRDWKARQIGFVNQDFGRDIVPPQGGGSSFDQFDFARSPSLMQVNERWKRYRDTPRWKYLVEGEVTEVSTLIFSGFFSEGTPSTQEVVRHEVLPAFDNGCGCQCC